MAPLPGAAAAAPILASGASSRSAAGPYQERRDNCLVLISKGERYIQAMLLRVRLRRPSSGNHALSSHLQNLPIVRWDGGMDMAPPLFLSDGDARLDQGILMSEMEGD
ncbi:hypothetical protein BS78_08G063900 [Paspalum vaginatum]|nr:hypothetical protein BS78_08G063900 [Paspalum vaginatum]